MSTESLPRPRQVTLSGWMIVLGSVFTVLFAFQQVSQLGSIEAQEAAADTISRPPIEGLGLSVDDVQFFIRLAAFVAAACGAAAAILGWQVLQRSRSARLALTVIAPFMLIAGMLTSGLAAALVAAAIVMLWAQPARDWFAGRKPARPAPGRTAEATVSTSDAYSASPQPSINPPEQSEQPAYGTAMSSPPPGEPPARPGSVLAACLTAIISSALTAILLAVSVVLFAGNRSDFVDEVEQQLEEMDAGTTLNAETVADAALVMLGVLVVWSLIAIVLAVLTLRGSNAARITLIVSSAMAALVSLIGILALVPLIITAACIATIVLLVVGGSSTWFAARRRS